MRKLSKFVLACSLILATVQTPALADFQFRWGTAGVQALNGTTSSVDCTAAWGTTVLDGDTVTAYQADNVPFGNTCNSEIQTCTGGTLSGTFTFQSCSVNPAANCTTPWSAPVAHGADVTAFQTASVPFGSTCNSETRNCFNGTLSGSFANQTCAPLAAANCTAPWGATVLHGATTTAYQTASVPFGSTCASEVRSCANGALSGSFANAACAPLPGAACGAQTVSWGTNCSGTIAAAAHGATSSSSNSAGGYLGTGNFSCSNGTWQNTGGTCAAAQQAPSCNMQTAMMVSGGTIVASIPSGLSWTAGQCAAWCASQGAQAGDVCAGMANNLSSFEPINACMLRRGATVAPQPPPIGVIKWTSGMCN